MLNRQQPPCVNVIHGPATTTTWKKRRSRALVFDLLRRGAERRKRHSHMETNGGTGVTVVACCKVDVPGLAWMEAAAKSTDC